MGKERDFCDNTTRGLEEGPELVVLNTKSESDYVGWVYWF